jgi:hypothetical protein
MAPAVGLVGVVPNCQRFVANAVRVRLVAAAAASLRGIDFGPMGKLDRRPHWVTSGFLNAASFAIGRAYVADRSPSTIPERDLQEGRASATQHRLGRVGRESTIVATTMPFLFGALPRCPASPTSTTLGRP